MTGGSRGAPLRGTLAAALLLARPHLPAQLTLVPPGCARIPSRQACGPNLAASLPSLSHALGSEQAVLALAGGRWRGTRGHAAVALKAVDGLEQAPAAEDVVEEVAKAAEKQVQSLAGRIAGLKRQLKDPSEADLWTNKGNALQTMPKSQWQRGMEEVEVTDWSHLDGDGQPMRMMVQLDAKKDFLQNAKACFKQAKKIKNAWMKVGPMLEQTEVDLERWRRQAERASDWREEASSAGSLSAESARLVMELYDAMLEEGIIKPPPAPAPLLDPEEVRRQTFKRKYGKDIDCYLTLNGHEVVAGRSSKMNEYISLKLAKGDMPWFHTDNGIPGSHVLIRAAWDDVPEEDFEFAAKLAAFHSKGKNDLHVPVMYCKGGDVRKPKGTKTGTVACTGKAYSMIVKPGLPEEV